MTPSDDPLVWIDCEMTGLDPETDTIMSIACFITAYDLDIMDDDGYEAVIHHPKEVLDGMGAWCRKHHGESGLTQACLDSTTTAGQAAEGLLTYIQKYVGAPRVALLAGNSVHADRSFLVKDPWNRIAQYLHYRILDVSTIKEAARRWSPDAVLKNVPKKKMLHEAREDILESIREARYYREAIFHQNNQNK